MLAEGWTNADNNVRTEYSAKFEQFRRLAEGGERENGYKQLVGEGEREGRLVEQATDEDVEMGDDVETPAPVASGGGFTAVNN